jgi:hypothetical protein
MYFIVKEHPMFVNIPFCHLPNSKFQQVDLETCYRTEQQIREVEKIGNDPDFAYFLMEFTEPTPVVFDPDCSGPLDTFWYSKDGVYNCTRIAIDGTARNEVCSFLNFLVPLDHPTYLCRTY